MTKLRQSTDSDQIPEAGEGSTERKAEKREEEEGGKGERRGEW